MTLSVARSSPLPVPDSDQGVGGQLHIKQSGVFDVDGNTNTDLNRVVTAYLFPLVIH